MQTGREKDTLLTDDALICGFQVAGQGPARPVMAIEMHAALETPETVTWLHFRLSDTRAERFLLDSETFPPPLRQHLTERDSHTVLEATPDGLMVVVTDLSFEQMADTGGAATLWGYATARSFVSARAQALHSVDALRRALRDGLHVASGIELVAVLFDLRNDALRQLTTDLDDEVNDVEDEILRGGIREQRERLGRARRRCAHVRRHFAPDRNALHKLLARPPAWLSAKDGEHLRSAVEDLAHLLDDTNELYERAKLLQEELAARLAEKTSDRLYVLSILSAVLLPMTLVTGIFGMNVAGLPGLTSDGAFLWTMVLVFAAGVVTLVLLRWKSLL